MKTTKLLIALVIAAAALPALAQTYPSYSAPTYAVPPMQACPQLSYNLYRGLSDRYTQGQVTQLQQFLSVRYGNQGVTGYFGNQTWANVARFQQEQAVYPVTGGVGPLTRAAITRVCGGYPTPTPVPTPQGVTVSSPSAGQTYAHGDQMQIVWQGPIRQTFAYEQHSSIIDLYSVSTGKVGTIGIYGDLSGSYAWSVPRVPNNLMCTMQYPNGLCGTNIPDGQYYIKVTAVVGSGFDNGTQLGVGQSGIFTIGSNSSAGQVSITGVSGPNSLAVNQSGTWSVSTNAPYNSYVSLNVRWGDETYYGNASSAAPQATSVSSQNTFTHSYAAAGTYTATFTATDSAGRTSTATASVVVSGNTTQSGFTAYPQSGYVPLTVSFYPNSYTGTYAVDFGDGQSASLQSGTVSHTYYTRGTFTAQFTSDVACMHQNPRCMIATMLLGSATVSVY